MSRPDGLNDAFADLYEAGLAEASIDADGEVRFRLVMFSEPDGRIWRRHPAPIPQP